MKTISLLAATILAVTGIVAGAHATVLYDNGAANGTITAPSISYGNEVADSFTLSQNSTVTGINFASWDYPSTTFSRVGWNIESSPTVPATLTNASTKSSYLFTNGNGYHIDENSFSTGSFLISAGTYYLLL